MSDPTIPATRADKAKLDALEAEERRDRRRNALLILLVFAVGVGVALWVGATLDDSQDTAVEAEQRTEQVEVEKFNLAQQIAAACADPEAEALDEATYARLCSDARTIVREGPRGAQGIPGVQGPPGVQGLQGPPGSDGEDGLPGPPGADGADGRDGADGATGDRGAPGEPPASWVVYDQLGEVEQRCVRADGFTASNPTYTCTPE